MTYRLEVEDGVDAGGVLLVVGVVHAAAELDAPLADAERAD